MGRILGVVLLAAGLLIATGSAAARASSPSELALPGRRSSPRASRRRRTARCSSPACRPGESCASRPVRPQPTTVRRAGVNVGTAGVMADPDRNVLWACAVDLSFQTAVRAARVRPADRGAGGELPHARRRTVRGHRARTRRRVRDRHPLRPDRPAHHPDRGSAAERLDVWSADPQLAGGGVPEINGIAFDGDRTLYTTNYSTGELFAVPIPPDGAAGRPSRSRSTSR